MSKYSVSWKDQDNNDYSQTFEALTATAAISEAIEKVKLLRAHPNLIYRVFLEDN